MTAPLVHVCPSESGDVASVVRILRAADVEELSAAGYDDPEQVIVKSLRLGNVSWTGWAKEGPVAIGGIAEGGSTIMPVGIPWMLGTDLLEVYAQEAIFKTRRIFRKMKWMYPNQKNYVHEKNELSLVWLSWLGYTIHPSAPFGPKGEYFHMFTLGDV